MIGVSVRDKNRVDIRKVGKRNSRRAHARQELSERGIEIGVGEKAPTPNLN